LCCSTIACTEREGIFIEKSSTKPTANIYQAADRHFSTYTTPLCNQCDIQQEECRAPRKIRVQQEQRRREQPVKKNTNKGDFHQEESRTAKATATEERGFHLSSRLVSSL
ncbi:hypothetical protein ILYODFUR_026390, partial [Ilyodon furcidens]